MIELKGKYQREEFLRFIGDEFLSDFNRDIREVNTSDLTSIQKANYLGESKILDLQIFEFFYDGSSNKRVALTKDAFTVMRSSAIFKALAVFKSTDSDDWRFSLLTATPEATEKGKVAVLYSNPKRLSFFLGPNAKINTPTKFLISKGQVIDFDDLKSRFSIEVVNKEFYKEISHAFTKLVSGMLKLPDSADKSQTNLEFAVRLIGRIIFCWFLKEKKNKNNISLVPKELLSLESISLYEDYYHNILEPIFFEMLNKPIKERIDKFTVEPYSTIPYLNGGLFSPEKDDFYKRGIYQSDFYNNLVIPDEWLKEFFAILETYNFTIDENTSYDEELSIDPEMLGRIFENLLAEINPDTGESARKSTGSYYTPRIIVDYMVDESLLLYLKQQTEIEEEKLKAVISYELTDDTDNPVTLEERGKIVDALEKVKILDPACGSGAFPIGALQKIVFILQQVDQDGSLWFKKQLAKASPEFRKDIEKKFSNKEFDFLRKLGVIRECIYGVDIQPIATEISRLRCFLTLIVDERIDDGEENRGIKPLPNLDFKFVTANSLIGLPNVSKSGPQQPEMFDDRENIDELKSIRDQYFTSSGVDREILKADFFKQQKKLLFDLQKTHGWAGFLKADLTNKLGSWDPFTHDKTDWFDPEWMFGIKEGFDIVIANPPYIQIKQIPQSDKKIYQNRFKSAVGRFNVFYFFLELASKLAKVDGLSSFIVPDRILLNTQCVGIRDWLLNEQQIIEIDSFAKEVFESAVVDSILLFYKNMINVSDYIYVKNSVLPNTLFSKPKSIVPITYFNESSNKQFNLSYDPIISDLMKKISSKSVLLGSISETRDGIIQSKIPDILFLKSPLDSDSKPLLFGKDIDRYRLTYHENYVNYKPQEMMKIELKRKGGGLRLRVKEIFERNKILTRQTADQIIAMWDDNKYYYSNTLHGTFITDTKYHPFYVLAILNSKLVTWYYRKSTAEEGKVFAQIKIELLRLLPILKVDSSQQQPFVDLVSRLLDINNLDREKTRIQIDWMIYELYELDKTEIDLIEKGVS